MRQHNEVLARLDLAQDRPCELTAVEVLEVYECVEAVFDEVLAD